MRFAFHQKRHIFYWTSRTVLDKDPLEEKKYPNYYFVRFFKSSIYRASHLEINSNTGRIRTNNVQWIYENCELLRDNSIKVARGPDYNLRSLAKMEDDSLLGSCLCLAVPRRSRLEGQTRRN